MQFLFESVRHKVDDMKETRTFPDELLQIAYEEKLFKLFVPTELGGRMLDLPEAVRIFQEASRADGSFGWLVTIGSGGNMFVENIERHRSEELFNPSDAVIAGSGFPSGMALKTKDGYEVTGEWKYCSGASYATLYTANSFVVEDGETTDKIISCIFLPEQVEVVEDWDAFGLTGTGSHTIKVKNAFVPLDCTFSIAEQKNNIGGAVHSFPFEQFSQSSFAAVCLGIGQSFLDEAEKVMNRKRSETEKYETLSELLEKQINQFQEAEQLFHTSLDKLWKAHLLGIEIQEADLQLFSQVCKNGAQTAIDCANALSRHLGMEMVRESTKLNRIWRDLYTAGQHAFLTT